ncbi:hypothetical protein HELRODRAFT_114428 [Helobdella robusta]|uniref:NAD-dependent protein deacetylase n=1 Tax=Helobdella robusta TaxID=6412 RepID=T1EG16_HELRO|nr:hypothetical protein HELRODRAFT_114428 [Helobdella robusta]ESN96841.1 hypothetical protein HELRODRAFT_114428 [Helobdella robusta]
MAEGGVDKKDSEEELHKEVVELDSKEVVKESACNNNFLQSIAAKFMGLFKSKPEDRSLVSVDLDGVVEFIRSGRCKNIISMAGAGLSTSAGIPDFRSPGSGLYDNLDEYDLPYPAAIFDLSYFKKNPEPFFVLAKNLLPTELIPTPCHHFLKLLHDKGLLMRHYTQNIDTLERLAGLPNEVLVEAHGTFNSGHCLKCRSKYDFDWMKNKIMSDTVPKCMKSGCKGVVKPDVVLFGENLPMKFFSLLIQDFSKCDLLIVLGTSLNVQPFASLVHKVPKKSPRLYVNLQKTSGSSFASWLIGGGSGFKFDDPDNERDVFWKGTCDDWCQLMAKKLNWECELNELITNQTTKIIK